MRIDDYINLLASENSTPGGGSAAALVCSLGASLVSMAASLSGCDAEADSARRVAKGALVLMTADEDAFIAYKTAARLSESNARADAVRLTALHDCTVVPYKVMLAARSALETADELRAVVKPAAQSDLEEGRLLLKAAAESAWLNIKANLALMEKDIFYREYDANGRALLEWIREA